MCLAWSIQHSQNTYYYYYYLLYAGWGITGFFLLLLVEFLLGFYRISGYRILSGRIWLFAGYPDNPDPVFLPDYPDPAVPDYPDPAVPDYPAITYSTEFFHFSLCVMFHLIFTDLS